MMVMTRLVTLASVAVELAAFGVVALAAVLSLKLFEEPARRWLAGPNAKS